MTNIAVFVSGNGTNLQRIADFFQNDDNVNIVCVVCNNPAAYAVQRAEKMNIPVIMVDKKHLTMNLLSNSCRIKVLILLYLPGSCC